MKHPRHILTRLARRAQRQRNQSKHDLRRMEIKLLRRQTWASWATVVATILLSSTLATLTYCQWQTAESTAAIERAKARPHFRIRQENQHDELGFLPRRFAVQPDAGVSDATEASATSIMLIHYMSRDLGISGSCRASFVNFYGWTNDAMSFELADAADRIMTLSRTPDRVNESFVRIQPLWVLVDISFTDVFGAPGRQTLYLFAGQPSPVGPAGRQRASFAGMELNLQVDAHGKVVIYRVSTTPAPSECVNALRVMNRIPNLRIGRNYIIPRDRSYLIVRNPNLDEGRGQPITATSPSPTVMNISN